MSISKVTPTTPRERAVQADSKAAAWFFAIVILLVSTLLGLGPFVPLLLYLAAALWWASLADLWHPSVSQPQQPSSSPEERT